MTGGFPDISVAPMMDWTDRHCRFFHRLLAPSVTLYTEMVTTGALLFGADPARHLAHDRAEHPVVLQLGGSEPDALARAAAMGAAAGFDAINLNCGCPSPRVQKGAFGACLMREGDLVARGVAAMIAAQDRPVTVKCRIGVDGDDSYDFFRGFVDKVADAGARTIIVHARKAWLKGLSPKENREVPPLSYPTVHRLKQERPDLTVILNGGVRSVAEIRAQLGRCDGVMIGRAAYESPWLLAEIEAAFGGRPPASRMAAVASMVPYLQARMAEGVPLVAMTRHMLGLYNGLRGARAFRQALSVGLRAPGAGVEALLDAARAIDESPLPRAA